MGVVETIALTMGVGWASGINLYAAVAMLGILGATGNAELPAELQIVQDPLVIKQRERCRAAPPSAPEIGR